MAFNGSGTFVRLYNWVNDAAANIKIRADRMDAEMDGMATGLSTCITKNGQTTITANLPMATYRHTGVGAAVNRTDYARTAEVQDGSINWVDGGGTADAITAAYGIPLTALVDGQLCFVRATAANATTTPTFSPSGLTARTIVKNGNQALVAGDIAGDGHELILRYRSSDTKWELLNPAGADFLKASQNITFTGNNTFSGKTLYPDDGELTIASGSITPTGVFHTVDTEADASSDDLDTIASASDGQTLIIRIENDARNVVIKHNTGNINTPDTGDIILDTTKQVAVLIYDGALSKWIVQAQNGYGLTYIGRQTFTASGSFTKATYPDATWFKIIVQAAGGGGGGADAVNTSNEVGGAGGGAGGYAEEWLAASALSSSETVTIGAVGTAGAAATGGNGGDGGSSSFGAFLSATGGTGGAGTGSGAASTENGGYLPGTGGVGSGGDLNFTGGAGSSSGAAAGTSTTGGTGGNSYFGGGGRGGRTSAGSNTNAAEAGGNYGGGGGGGADSTTSGAAGGAGGPGIIIVEAWKGTKP